MAKLSIRSYPTHKVPLEGLRELTLPTGTMWAAFRDARAKKVGRVYVAYSRGKPIGWLLQRPNPPWEPKATDDAKLYVRGSFRNKGIGEALIAAAAKRSGGRMLVYPWSPSTDRFFAGATPPKTIFCTDWSERGINIRVI